MDYCLLADLKLALDELSLIQLSNDDAAATAVDQAVIDRAVSDAQALIDSYCGGRFTVPFSPVPVVIRQQAVTLTIYNLFFRRQGAPEEWIKRHDSAIKWLESVAKGQVSIADASAIATEKSVDGVQVSAATPVFTLDTLEGY